MEAAAGTHERVLLRRRVIVSGLVQGVFFRDSCRSRAVPRSVTGFVRNRADGTVEAVFEGEPPAVEEMIAWCRVGPPSAVVENVEVTEEEPRGETAFRIV
jgi:acylphosphatase